MSFLFLLGCGDNVEGDDEAGQCPGETGDIFGGAWVGVEDWADPGAPGNDSLTGTVCGWPDPSAHHCFSTAIHAVHMHTGEVLMYHGEQDQRVWKIGSDPDLIEWHPNLLLGHEPTVTALPDMFCSGHVQLADGRIFTAGGNVNGNPARGGLLDTFLFDPVGAPAAEQGQPVTCSYGWLAGTPENGFVSSATPQLQLDRWYPTLTMIRDGRILVSGGFSFLQGVEEAASVDLSTCELGMFGCACVPSDPPTCHSDDPDLTCYNGRCIKAHRTGLLEIYDPISNDMEALTGAQFPIEEFPIYPFMFLLPNGDVFYAGSEDAVTAGAEDGRFLVIDYNAPPSAWTWDAKVVESEVTGGSAVMFQAGVVLKTGGPTIGNTSRASNLAERIDLRTYASGDYDAVPADFPDAAPMVHARHFHSLVALPNGNVLAVGGNSHGNGQNGESPNNPCVFEGQDIHDLPCDQGCPSVCADHGGYYYGFSELACATLSENLECSVIGLITCTDAAQCESVLPGAVCSGGRCRKPCESDADCGTLQNACSMDGDDRLESPQFPGNCNPANVACSATYNAEMYDPSCDRWEELDPQQHPRMYHSSALLMPDGRVLSMGGGHRQGTEDHPISEYFSPRYAPQPNAPRPVINWGNLGGIGSGESPLLAYGGTLELDVTGPAPERFTLLRLGSATHGFDQDQRFLELSFVQSMGSYVVAGPTNASWAPPGYYMLFALSATGQPSVGGYVRVGDES